MSIVISELVASAWSEALANPDIARWRSLAYLAGFQADTIQKHDPDSLVGIATRAVSEAAWRKCMDMMPAQEPEDYNSLAGVLVGWFKRIAA